MALGHLGDLGSELGDPLQLPGRRLDADDRGQLVPERAGIDLGAVAGDHARALEALHAFRRRRRGEAHPPAELRERDPAVRDELADDLAVRCVEFPYALFVALLPATATAIGVVVLRQLPSAVDLGGIGLVMARVALHREQSRR
jgi:hypothetical protein